MVVGDNEMDGNNKCRAGKSLAISIAMAMQQYDVDPWLAMSGLVSVGYTPK